MIIYNSRVFWNLYYWYVLAHFQKIILFYTLLKFYCVNNIYETGRGMKKKKQHKHCVVVEALTKL